MAKAVRKPTTRAQWAAKICAAHNKSFAAILELGLTLTAAKNGLPHGEWLKMIKHDLPFTATVAQRLMKIAADPKLSNPANAHVLPAAWSALYELTKLPKQTFTEAAATGAINPTMTRDDVRRIRIVVSELSDPPPPLLAVPIYGSKKEKKPGPPLSLVANTAKPAPSEPPLDLSACFETEAKVSQLEKLVTNLKAAVERGDIVVNAALELRLRAVANRLLALNSQRRIVTVS